MQLSKLVGRRARRKECGKHGVKRFSCASTEKKVRGLPSQCHPWFSEPSGGTPGEEEKNCIGYDTKNERAPAFRTKGREGHLRKLPVLEIPKPDQENELKEKKEPLLAGGLEENKRVTASPESEHGSPVVRGVNAGQKRTIHRRPWMGATRVQEFVPGTPTYRATHPM